MYERSVNDMISINNSINKIIHSPQKKISTSEARKILRDCGIFNSKNQIKSAYKGIIIESIHEDRRK